MTQFDICVVGAGSAGLTAALHAAKADSSARVLILEKSDRIGGNSAKASSGISATRDAGDLQAFKDDIIASGGGLSNEALVQTLVEKSASAVEWLRFDIGVELDDERVRMGGHSAARTYTFRKGAVGVEIMKKLSKAIDKEPRITVETNARVTSLLQEGDRVVGCEADVVTETGETFHRKYAVSRGVILASGGFGHQFEMIERYLRNETSLCTTNGPFATGDGIFLGEAVGGHGIQLEQIQIHPTGFVDPRNPEGSTKILAPEKLRGLGGILIDTHGRRFTDELGTRRAVAEAINALNGRVAILVIDGKIATKVGPAMEFYNGRRLFQSMTVKELADALSGVDDEWAFETRLREAGLDVGTLQVARVTPAVHYTMGGLAMDVDGAAVDKAGQRIRGLWVAGEVSGGVHGMNRLGGCSLLDCLVYGAIAGTQSVAR